jgi:hypothetical protein
MFNPPPDETTTGDDAARREIPQRRLLRAISSVAGRGLKGR